MSPLRLYFQTDEQKRYLFRVPIQVPVSCEMDGCYMITYSVEHWKENAENGILHGKAGYVLKSSKELVNLGKQEEAEVILRSALQRRSWDELSEIKMLTSLSKLVMEKDPNEVLQLIDASKKNDSGLVLMKATALSNLNKTLEAITLLENEIELKPGARFEPDIASKLSILYRQVGNDQKAVDFLAPLIEEGYFKDHLLIKQILADAYIRTRKADKALSLLEGQLDLRSKEMIERARQALGGGNFTPIGDTQVETETKPRSIMDELDKEKERLLKLAKGNVEIFDLVNHAFLEISEGNERILNSDIGKIEAKGAIPIATSLAEIAHRKYPGNIYFIVKFGSLLQKNNDLETAKKVVEDYRNKFGDSGNQRFIFLEASILKNLRQYKDAIEIFEKLNTPKNEQFHVRDALAQCYYLMGDYSNAKSVLEGKRLSFDGILILAQIYMQEQQDGKAYAILKPNLGKNRKIDNFYNSYFADKGNYDEPKPETETSDKFVPSLEIFKNEHDPKRTVFIMMKFSGGDPQKDNMLIELFNTIKLELNNYGLDAIKADEKNYSDTDYLWDNVQIYIRGCAYGIAILENLYSEEMNPNAALEYGYMLAIGNKKVLLLKEKLFRNVRADILGKIWKEFEFENSESIKKSIMSWMVDLGIQRIKA